MVTDDRRHLVAATAMISVTRRSSAGASTRALLAVCRTGVYRTVG
jgi:hypothetical protein